MKALPRARPLGLLIGIVLTGWIASKDSGSSRTFLGASVARAEEETCSTASLRGTYAVYAQGTIVGQLPSPPFGPAPLPFGEVGIVTLDGAGHLTGKVTGNIGGVVLHPTITGTYNVNSDCTGTVVVYSSAGFVIHDDIVLTRGGRGTRELQTDSFAVVSRTLEKIAD